MWNSLFINISNIKCVGLSMNRNYLLDHYFIPSPSHLKTPLQITIALDQQRS
uniref:Uncharacterized protein n=1 Tax=Lepeophtheirus salmonis TaxID=72036 RepID=A0A0K2U9R3_LEPSM